MMKLNSTSWMQYQFLFKSTTTKPIQALKGEYILYLFWWNKYRRSLVYSSRNFNSFFLKQKGSPQWATICSFGNKHKPLHPPPCSIPSRQEATPNIFPWYPRTDSWMTVVKYTVKCPRENFQYHFSHFLDVCLSTLSVFFLTIQGIDALNSHPWFAGHTNLWVNLSHWICLLHRSWFQDNPQPE